MIAISRPHRYYSTPDTVYHVISRGNNRQQIFSDSRDYFRYLDLWRKYKAEMDFEVYAYVLMPNHVHWLIKTGLTPLSEIMHRTHSTYARWFNHRHERVGHLFQNRYKSIVCDTDNYLLVLARYIHLNPVRAGLVKEILHYPWSSYPGYCGHEDALLNTSFLLQYFGPDLNKSRTKFIDFTREGLENLDETSALPPIPENRHLEQQKEKRHQVPFDSNNKYSNQAKQADNSSCLSLNKLADWIEQETGATLQELQSNTQQFHVVAARYLFIRIAVGEADFKRSQVAKFLNKSRANITQVLEKWSQDKVSNYAKQLFSKYLSISFNKINF